MGGRHQSSELFGNAHPRLLTLIRESDPGQSFGEDTLCVIAKEACRLRQSTENFRWIATSPSGRLRALSLSNGLRSSR